MSKTLYTLNVDHYAPEITKLTYPLLKRYATKIGAEFHIITKRKWPKLPPVYEKLQIFDLARERRDEWSYYIDSDALVHPDMFDPTEFVHKDTVMHNGNDMANNRWRYDYVFRRDGRHIGSCNWFTIASEWCRDLWAQPDITYEQCLENIFPIQMELSSVITREHLIDDYVLSRNIARFGLKFTTVSAIQQKNGDPGDYFYHQYTATTEQKINGWDNEVVAIDGTVSLSHQRGMLEVLRNWKV